MVLNCVSIYVCGETYLALHDDDQAATEFQKFIDHRGVMGDFLLGALAQVGLARAYVVEMQSAQGEAADAARAKARAALQDFLTLWKDTDPDISILKQAKAEYARLRSLSFGATASPVAQNFAVAHSVARFLRKFPRKI